MHTAVTNKHTVEFVYHTASSVENIFQTVGGYFPHCSRVLHTEFTWLLIKKCWKFKKVICFSFYQSRCEKQLKKQNSLKFWVFTLKNGGLKQGYTPSRPLRGLDGYPCFRPPFSNWKTQNYRSFGFSNCFPQLLLEKRETKYYCLILDSNSQTLGYHADTF